MSRAQPGQVFKIQNDCSNTFISFRAFNHLDQIAQNDLVLRAAAHEQGLQRIADAFVFDEQTAWLEEQRGVVVNVLALATADETAGKNEQDALIAYLQVLGTAIKAGSPAKAEIQAPAKAQAPDAASQPKVSAVAAPAVK